MTCFHLLDAMANFKYINKLRDKLVLIFGASSGFGYAVAEAAIEHGARVILSGSNQDRLNRAVRNLRSSYPDVDNACLRIIVCDLTQIDTLEHRLLEVFNDLTNNGAIKIDHIVFTADDAHRAPNVSETSPEDIYLSLRMRSYSSVILSKVVAANDFVVGSSEGSLTFTNGSSAHKPVQGWAVPAMAATSLEGLVRGLAVDLAPFRVNLVSAGPVSTELLESLPPGVIKKYEEETLTKRLGRPEDIAEAYIYIMKDCFVTGSILFSDGGRRLA